MTITKLPNFNTSKGRVHSKKKKNILNFGADPPQKLRKTKIYDDWKDIFCRRKKIPWKNLKNSTNWVNIMNIFQVLVVRRWYPPMKKKIFSADLHELGHEKIKIKEFRKWGKFVLTPPHFKLFFLNENFPCDGFTICPQTDWHTLVVIKLLPRLKIKRISSHLLIPQKF